MLVVVESEETSGGQSCVYIASWTKYVRMRSGAVVCIPQQFGILVMIGRDRSPASIGTSEVQSTRLYSTDPKWRVMTRVAHGSVANEVNALAKNQ